MKKYLNTYRPFLRFLVVFFLSYGVLSFLYSQYLSQYQDKLYPVDPFTESVSYQVKTLSNIFGADVDIHKIESEKWTRMTYNNHYIARIVEGCNAVSVMILFVAFVIAFAGKFKKTLAFIAVGLLLIHILNIARISALGYFLYYKPEQEHLFHGVLFPLVIYGFVFLLWVVWVTKYSGFIPAKNNEKA